MEVQQKIYACAALSPALIFLVVSIVANPDGGTNALIMLSAFTLLAIGTVSSFKSVVLSKSILSKSLYSAFVLAYVAGVVAIIYSHTLRLLGNL